MMNACPRSSFASASCLRKERLWAPSHVWHKEMSWLSVR